MTRPPKRCFLLVLGFILASLVTARPAAAGSLRVRDEAHALSPEDVSRLRSVVSAAPFDGRLVVTSEYAQADELSRYVGSLVTEPNAVAVGIDPQHRHVQVHFGTGSGIARSEWPAIERAGNDAFRRGDYGAGAEAIFQAASRAAGTAEAPPGKADDRAAAAHRPSLFGPAALFVLVVGGLGLVYYLTRRRPWTGGGNPVAPYGSPYGGGPGPYSGGPGYPPGYAPPPTGGMGAMGGGLLGAGLGGVAGYELGKLEAEREERLREEREAPAPADDDAGGGGSSWDDGSGGDAGGGGDDFGGGDGGGGDAGGGGSDWS